MKNKQQGFTLIELLVVIAIISLLATMAVASLRSAQAKSRDTRRVADLEQIRTALDLYYEENSGYSASESDVTLGGIAGWDVSTADADGDGNFFMDILVDSGHMPNPPVDVLNDSSHYLAYYYYSGYSVSNGCQGPYYVLAAIGIETDGFNNDNVCFTGLTNNDANYFIVVEQ